MVAFPALGRFASSPRSNLRARARSSALTRSLTRRHMGTSPPSEARHSLRGSFNLAHAVYFPSILGCVPRMHNAQAGSGKAGPGKKLAPGSSCSRGSLFYARKRERERARRATVGRTDRHRAAIREIRRCPSAFLFFFYLRSVLHPRETRGGSHGSRAWERKRERERETERSSSATVNDCPRSLSLCICLYYSRRRLKRRRALICRPGKPTVVLERRGTGGARREVGFSPARMRLCGMRVSRKGCSFSS